LIEVADTTLKKDCELKAIAYAQSGITDYWVLDIKARQLHVFRDPTQNGYLAHEILSERECISLIAFPTANLDVCEMLRPLA
jgi:Uma2 family endonuclease